MDWCCADDFIVDDEGKPISNGKKKRHIIHDDVYVIALLLAYCSYFFLLRNQ